MWWAPKEPAKKTTSKTPIPIGIADIIPSKILSNTTPQPDSVA